MTKKTQVKITYRYRANYENPVCHGKWFDAVEDAIAWIKSELPDQVDRRRFGACVIEYKVVVNRSGVYRSQKYVWNGSNVYCGDMLG